MFTLIHYTDTFEDLYHVRLDYRQERISFNEITFFNNEVVTLSGGEYYGQFVNVSLLAREVATVAVVHHVGWAVSPEACVPVLAPSPRRSREHIGATQESDTLQVLHQ